MLLPVDCGAFAVEAVIAGAAVEGTDDVGRPKNVDLASLMAGLAAAAAAAAAACCCLKLLRNLIVSTTFSY